MQFHLLKNETWQTVYKDSDTNTKFKRFLLTFLNIFKTNFQINYKSVSKLKSDCVRFEVIVASSMKMRLFWDIGPCSLTEVVYSSETTLRCTPEDSYHLKE
jgi:hypothetical protein